MSINIQSKLPEVGTTIFTVMSALATQHKAINLGQGFPDFEMPEALMEAVNKAMRDGFNQYAPMQGYLPLREALAEKIKYLYDAVVNPADEITITPGGTYAIYTSLTTVLKKGDEVIVFQPCYDSYIPNIEVNGATPVLVDLEFPDYSINWEKVKEKITSRTRMIMLNSPHNPTGSIISAEDIKHLIEITRGTNILVLSDEVYEHLIYDGADHHSMLKYPELRERSFVCFSFGKVYHCTGWKLGYCVAPAAFTNEFRKVHQFNCFSCHSPSQVGLSHFLQDRSSYTSLSGFLQEKRDRFIRLMQNSKFDFLESSGSYFICATYKKISDEPDTAFAKKLVSDAGVAVIPISSFYQDGTDNKVIRFCFAKKAETLETAAERLSKI